MGKLRVYWLKTLKKPSMSFATTGSISPHSRTTFPTGSTKSPQTMIHTLLNPADPLATPATIRSRPRQQANRQHLTSTTRPLYPIAINRDQRTPLAHSSPSIPSSSLSPSVCMPSSKVLVPHLFCSRKPRTLIANASITMPRYRSLPFATPRYDPRHSLSPLLTGGRGGITQGVS